MLIDRIERASVPGADGEVDIDCADGRIDWIGPSGEAPTGPPRTVLPVGGRVVVPAFVDAHVHLDKAHLLAAAEAACTLAPNLGSALSCVAAARGTVTHATVLANARRAVEGLIEHGVTAARAHVELDPSIGLELVDLHEQLVDEFSARILLQGVAFPQAGLDHPAMPGLLRAAMARGLPVVGGCPYLDREPAAHLDLIFGLADKHGTPVDLHLDFSDEPSRSLIVAVAERTRALGLQGRVAVGHVTTLAAMEPRARAAALDTMAASGVALISLPATDLYLAGQGSSDRPACAPIVEAHDAGVLVAIGNNNIDNPFSPFGNASPLHAAWLAGLVGRTATATDRAVLLASITDHPARILGLPPHVLAAGAPADLAVLAARHPASVVSQAPAVVVTIRGGAVVHTLAAPLVVCP